MKSVFFCPVYDEAREFPRVLEGLRDPSRACDEVLLVDNGSSDGSERLVRESGLPFLRIPHNRGLGYAFMTALDWALERRFDLFGAIAANGKMLPSEMPRLLDPLLRGEADCVTGSRFLAGGASPNLPAFRRRTIPAVNALARLATGARLTDATCGYRAYRIDPLERAGFDWHAPRLQRYGFEFYVYAKYLRDPALRCIEVPITMAYPDDGTPYTKIPPVLGWASMLRPWISAALDGKGFRPTPGND